MAQPNALWVRLGAYAKNGAPESCFNWVSYGLRLQICDKRSSLLVKEKKSLVSLT